MEKRIKFLGRINHNLAYCNGEIHVIQIGEGSNQDYRNHLKIEITECDCNEKCNTDFFSFDQYKKNLLETPYCLRKSWLVEMQVQTLMSLGCVVGYVAPKDVMIPKDREFSLYSNAHFLRNKFHHLNGGDPITWCDEIRKEILRDGEEVEIQVRRFYDQKVSRWTETVQNEGGKLIFGQRRYKTRNDYPARRVIPVAMRAIVPIQVR